MPDSPDLRASDVRHIAPALHRWRYELVERSESRLAFVYSYRPGWTYGVAVLFLPVGLLALLHTREEHVVIELEPDRRRGGTHMIVRGNAPQRVRRAFAQLPGP